MFLGYRTGWAKFAIGRPIWLCTYILILFALGLAFSFVNMSGEEIAEKMKKSGEYIYNIYPGEATSRYINWLILRFAIIGSTYYSYYGWLANVDGYI